MNGTQFNRTVCLLAYMALVGYLAYLDLETQNLVTVAGIIGMPLGTYIGIKGRGKQSE